MGHRGLSWAVVGWLTVAEGIFAGEPIAIPQLVEQLGSPRFREREAATRALLQVGPPALPVLQQQRQSDDPEVVRRAQQLIAQIEVLSIHQDLARVPNVRFRFDRTPPALVASTIQQQIGLEIVFPPDRPPTRAVTIDTGDVSVWQALQQVFHAAGWEEVHTPPNLPSVPQPAPIAPDFTHRVYSLPAPPTPPWKRLLVQARTQEPLPCDVRTVVRVSALPTTFRGAERSRGDNRSTIMLDVIPAPHLNWHNTQEVRIDRIIDARGRALEPLSAIEQPDANVVYGDIIAQIRAQPVQIWSEAEGLSSVPSAENPRHRPVSFRFLDDEVKSLQELRGTVIGKVQSPPRHTLTLPSVNAGSAASSTQSAVRVLKYRSDSNGEITIQLSLTTQVEPLSNEGEIVKQRMVRIRGRALPFLKTEPIRTNEPMESRWELLDAAGKPIRLVYEECTMQQQIGLNRIEELTLRFQRDAEQVDASELRLFERRWMMLEVPFVLQNVPIP